ncbi:MAG: DUF1294 domain-containing protein [Pseudomonadota bacterium]
MILAAIAVWLILINLIAWAFFEQDKYAARVGRQRISENTLLMLAFLGGSPGALAAQQILRHKTRKQPFKLMLYLIAAFQAAVVGLFLLLSVF